MESGPRYRVIECICLSFIEKANQFLRSDACCNVSTSVALEAINKSIRDLLQMNEDMIKKRNQIFFLEQYPLQEAVYAPPPLQDWEEALNQNNRELFGRDPQLLAEPGQEWRL